MIKILIAFIFLFSFNTMADDVFVIIVKKQEAKRTNGWSLSEWMLQKKQFALQDQWLALHTSSTLLEFFIGAETGGYDLTQNNHILPRQKKAAKLGAFVSIFGLEYSYERSNEAFKEQDLKVALRVLGKAVQGTHLTLHYGQRKREYNRGPSLYLDDEFKNNYWGGHLSLYLFPFLGVEGIYHKYFAQKSSKSLDISGDLIELIGFIDISFIRFYITKSTETLDLKNPLGVKSQEKRKGTKIGIKLFF